MYLTYSAVGLLLRDSGHVASGYSFPSELTLENVYYWVKRIVSLVNTLLIINLYHLLTVNPIDVILIKTLCNKCSSSLPYNLADGHTYPTKDIIL